MNFRAHYACAHFLSVLLLFTLRREISKCKNTLLVGSSLVLLCYYALIILPFYFDRSQKLNNASVAAKTLRILYANLYINNSNPALIDPILEREQPDIVFFLELSPEAKSKIPSLAKFPFAKEALANDPYALALYSKFPFEGEELWNVGEEYPPVLVTSVAVSAERKLTLALFHTYPPHMPDSNLVDRILLRRLGTYLRHIEGDLIVASDLNATPFSAFYRNFVAGVRLENSMRGFGWVGTWNALSAFLRFPLDHIFYRGELSVAAFTRLEACGSDHFPLLVDFEMR